jgi:UDP:flavonoid glycosyltransferase YjiC (YdhE family)
MYLIPVEGGQERMVQVRGVPRIAYFVSPHGYGHAARACAVMAAAQRSLRGLEFEVYTAVPRWFFEDSLQGRFRYHSLLTDIGFAQRTPLEIDIEETVSRLDRFYPLDPALVSGTAEEVIRKRCALAVCDISPLGIEVARVAGIPSVLIENFTWDWLYEPYAGCAPGLTRHIRFLEPLFSSASFHVQTEPVCSRGNADLTTAPVSRQTRRPRSEIRRRLGIRRGERLVLVTMGGIRSRIPGLKMMENQRGVRFVVPGAVKKPRLEANLILLPQRSDYFHPDLVSAADAVVGKVGYSTLAETYRAGVPFGYIARKEFRESEVLVSFVEKEMEGFAVDEPDFFSGKWLSRLPALLARPRKKPKQPNGAREIVRFILEKTNR